MSTKSIETNNLEENTNKSISIAFFENKIREKFPNILDILLIDRTNSTEKKIKNIIWANENYINQGIKLFAPKEEIRPDLVTGLMKEFIKPRALKHESQKRERTKTRAEVFTPFWIVKAQNDEVERDFLDDDIETYVSRTWIEVTCGEAPYMVTRYDMQTGELIPLVERAGFVDRKLRRINLEAETKIEWQQLVVKAYQSSFGFEWNGDSLFLARENLLYTYHDYYFEKWGTDPSHKNLEEIAEIISYNVFQMDGSTFTIPLSEQKDKAPESQMSLFDDELPELGYIIKPGKRVKIMNWNNSKMEFFDKGVV